jgi:hypothetical protein
MRARRESESDSISSFLPDFPIALLAKPINLPIFPELCYRIIGRLEIYADRFVNRTTKDEVLNQTGRQARKITHLT